MLEELDSLRPFQRGMQVLDPAWGSGAFLVQCYRRLIEQDEEFRPDHSMRPARLRELLEQHIFGIDRDACRVAELSLSLTLLDYVEPPDLERMPRFRLPKLHDSNIFQGDFFDPAAKRRETLATTRCDWIVGNPPWVELKSSAVSEGNRHVWQWMQDRTHQEQFPVDLLRSQPAHIRGPHDLHLQAARATPLAAEPSPLGRQLHHRRHSDYQRRRMTISRRKEDAARSANKPIYRTSFVHHSHEILKLGYDRLPAPSFSAHAEEDITGELTRAMQNALEDRGSPQWAKNFWVTEEVRVHDPNRLGKRRRRINRWQEKEKLPGKDSNLE